MSKVIAGMRMKLVDRRASGPLPEGNAPRIPSRKGGLREEVGRVGVGAVGRRDGLHGSEELLGFRGFLRLEGMEEPEIAYELTEEAWESSLATEAARACISYAFEVAGLGRVIAGADAPNVASLRVMENSE